MTMIATLGLMLLVAAIGAVMLRRLRRADRSPTEALDRLPEAGPDDNAAAPDSDTAWFTPVHIPREPSAAQMHKAREEEAAQEVGADFYEEVVGLLEIELSRNPHRQDLRFKLLEVYAATDRKEPFIALAAEHLRAAGNKHDAYWPQIIEHGRRIAPDHALFPPPIETPAAEPATPAPPQKFRRYYDSVDQKQLGAAQVEIHKVYLALRQDATFWRELKEHAAALLGEPAPLQASPKLSRFVGGAKIFVRNDALRPAANAAFIGAIGQALLARAMGRKRLIAAPQEEGHALAVAAIAQRLGLEAQLVMTPTEQVEHAPELAAAIECGAMVEFLPEALAPTESQRQALSRAIADPQHALYISPLAAGPFPYPVIVREVQGVFGQQLKAQFMSLTGRALDGLIVNAADGMPAIGFLQPCLGISSVRLFCVEPGTDERSAGGHHRLRREHAWLHATRRVRYSQVPEEVARFAARYCLPDHVESLNRAGGEVLVETFTLSRQFTADQSVVVVIPADASRAAAARHDLKP